MPTTTIRLPDDLKARVAATERAGTKAHSFILQAIAEKADTEDRRSDFHDEADKRYTGIVSSGKAMPWSEMRSYMQQCAQGRKLRPPAARKLAR